MALLDNPVLEDQLTAGILIVNKCVPSSRVEAVLAHLISISDHAVLTANRYQNTLIQRFPVQVTSSPRLQLFADNIVPIVAGSCIG